MKKSIAQTITNTIYGNLLYRLFFPSWRSRGSVPHNAWCSVRPGHFYSPIPSQDDVVEGKSRLLFSDSKFLPRTINGIDLNENEQFENLKKLFQYYEELPFPDTKHDEFRYYYLNDSYSYTDAIFLYSMIRDKKPKQIIEIGCGKTTALMMDVNQRYFNNEIRHICIEPYPAYLYECIREDDIKKMELIAKKVQDVDPGLFASLTANDILFIDCSHVVKFNSDVVHIFNHVLPHLNTGVFIHFHDIFYPFEIPSSWIDRGMYWNETYLLKNFLAYNSEFKIYLFGTFLHTFYHEWFLEHMPLTLKNQGGNIWIERVCK